jgi:hypothetical protein
MVTRVPSQSSLVVVGAPLHSVCGSTQAAISRSAVVHSYKPSKLVNNRAATLELRAMAFYVSYTAINESKDEGKSGSGKRRP